MKKYKFLFVLLAFIFCTSILVQAGNADSASKKTKINVKKLTLTKNESYTLRVYNMKKNQTVKFVSDNETIVMVNEKRSALKTSDKCADITAVNVGSTSVRANIYSKKGKLVRSLKTKIKVTPYAISIKFTQKKVTLDVSDIMKLSVIIKPSTSQELPLFSTSDPDVVTVNSRGVITAAAPGEAVITATLLSNGQKASCTVYVLPEEEDDSEDDYNSL
ncbi:MAG: Ig-like domain-containing protein [Roseburia sp.]|nr:Ig-like domain-containing protein [Roseburia sp.]